MRHVSPYRRENADREVAMTPMIDVVFLLLVFFVWTASFHAAELVLPSSVSQLQGSLPQPTDAPPPEEDFDDLVIRILWQSDQPQWLVNEAPVASLGEVRGTLAQIHAIKPDAPVILHPDPQVPLDYVIDAYDVTRLEGFQEVQFAVSSGL